MNRSKSTDIDCRTNREKQSSGSTGSKLLLTSIDSIELSDRSRNIPAIRTIASPAISNLPLVGKLDIELSTAAHNWDKSAAAGLDSARSNKLQIFMLLMSFNPMKNRRLPLVLEVGKRYSVPCIRLPDIMLRTGIEELYTPVLVESHIDRVDIVSLFARLTNTRSKVSSRVALAMAENPPDTFEHFHLDTRFTKRDRPPDVTFMANVIRQLNEEDEIDIVWKKKTCLRLTEDGFLDYLVPLLYQPEAQAANLKMRDCRICPHQNIRLEGVPVNSSGIVTCPAHGLQWNTKTGDLIPRPERTFPFCAIAFSPTGYESKLAQEDLSRRFDEFLRLSNPEEPEQEEEKNIGQNLIKEVIWKKLPELNIIYFSEEAFELDRVKYEN